MVCSGVRQDNISACKVAPKTDIVSPLTVLGNYVVLLYHKYHRSRGIVSSGDNLSYYLVFCICGEYPYLFSQYVGVHSPSGQNERSKWRGVISGPGTFSLAEHMIFEARNLGLGKPKDRSSSYSPGIVDTEFLSNRTYRPQKFGYFGF